jgi:hypothetical protein
LLENFYKLFNALHYGWQVLLWCKRSVVMAEILEVIMIVSFGASWPLNVIKSYKARTTKGKSLAFLCLIFFGYIAGIISKFLNEAYMASFSSKWYVLFFYVLNFLA